MYVFFWVEHVLLRELLEHPSEYLLQDYPRVHRIAILLGPIWITGMEDIRRSEYKWLGSG